MTIVLSSDQQKVYDAMRDWMATKHVGNRLLTVGGYAGVGKTSLLGNLAANTDTLFAFVCYTGRAASILRRKLEAAGVATTSKVRRTRNDNRRWCPEYFDDTLPMSSGPHFCSTIHKLFYRPVIDSKTQELMGWKKRTDLDRYYKFVVVDEASMVSDDILRTMQQHGVPVIAVGDHGQLPPVMASGELMKKPMLKLEKIHRQASGNPIITLSKHIREGGWLAGFTKRDDRVRYVPRKATKAVVETAFSGCKSTLDAGFLCWRNETRVGLNALVRSTFGIKGSPKKSEIVICLKNEPPVYNGMRGILTSHAEEISDRPWQWKIAVEFPDDGILEEEKDVCGPQFGREHTFQSLDELRQKEINVSAMTEAGSFYDWGYALTTHKSQGSEFSHAVLYMDRRETPENEDYRRWIYTSVTRASERLTVIQ